MPITEERIQELTDYGFTATAARVYLALLDLGVAEARDISTLSRVPTSKIYHTLEGLHEKGLVTIHPEYPKRYSPVPLREYLLKLQAEHQRTAAQIREDLDRLTRRYGVKGSVDVGGSGEFAVLRGRRNVLDQAGEMTQSAEQEVLLLGTRGTAARTRKCLEPAEAAHKRGAEVRAMFPMDPGTLPDLEALRGLYDIRERVLDEEGLGENVAILIVDGAQALIAHFNPDDGHLYQGEDTAIFTDHEAVVPALHALLRSFWGRAVDFRTRRDEMEGRRLREFLDLYTDHADLIAAIQQAAARGVREFRFLRAHVTEEARQPWMPVVQALREAGATNRLLAHGGDPEEAMEVVRRVEMADRTELRHLGARESARALIFDDREAFVSVGGAEVWGPSNGPPEIFMHTSNPTVVRALCTQFETLWREAESVEGASDDDVRAT